MNYIYQLFDYFSMYNDSDDENDETEYVHYYDTNTNKQKKDTVTKHKKDNEEVHYHYNQKDKNKVSDISTPSYMNYTANKKISGRYGIILNNTGIPIITTNERLFNILNNMNLKFGKKQETGVWNLVEDILNAKLNYYYQHHREEILKNLLDNKYVNSSLISYLKYHKLTKHFSNIYCNSMTNRYDHSCCHKLVINQNVQYPTINNISDNIQYFI